MANDDRLDLRLPTTEKDLFTRAAEAEAMPVSMWIRRVCRAAAQKLLGKEPAAGDKKRSGR